MRWMGWSPDDLDSASPELVEEIKKIIIEENKPRE